MIEITQHGTMIDAQSVPFIHMLALRGALRLELRGLTRRGRSAYAIVKEEFGLKGSKQSVFDQFSELVQAQSARETRSRIASDTDRALNLITGS